MIVNLMAKNLERKLVLNCDVVGSVSDRHPIDRNLSGHRSNVIYVDFKKSHSRSDFNEATQTTAASYSFSDPVNFVDLNGLAPGDPFPTEAEAAGDALNYINPISIGQNREYGGHIVRSPDGTYSATMPIKGGPAGVNIGRVPAGGTASYHTHGGFDPRYDNENFSPADLLGDMLDGINGYLATPGGSIQMNRGGRIKKGLICQ